MHYHILFYTNLSYKDLQKKMKDIVDYKIESIYYQKGLLRYFKKNINYDIIYILKQDSKNNSELREKQIEILKYKFSGSFDYKVLGSNVSVEQYIKVV